VAVRRQLFEKKKKLLSITCLVAGGGKKWAGTRTREKTREDSGQSGCLQAASSVGHQRGAEDSGLVGVLIAALCALLAARRGGEPRREGEGQSGGAEGAAGDEL